MTIDDKLDLLINEMSSMKSEMSSIKSEMSSMESETSSIKSEIAAIKATMVSKEDLAKAEAKLYDEIVRAEMQSEKTDKRVDVLTEKVDTLLLQADNTAIMLRMVNDQAVELEKVNVRLERMEQKLA